METASKKGGKYKKKTDSKKKLSRTCNDFHIKRSSGF